MPETAEATTSEFDWSKIKIINDKPLPARLRKLKQRVSQRFMGRYGIDGITFDAAQSKRHKELVSGHTLAVLSSQPVPDRVQAEIGRMAKPLKTSFTAILGA